MGQAHTGLSPATIFGRPTAEQLWQGPAQRRALTFLRTPIQGTTKLLLGPRGCGKSTLLDAFLEELEQTVYFKSRDGWDSGAALLRALLESTDLTPSDGLDVTQRNLFSSYLNQQRSLGRRIVIAIDDAERLTPDVWRELYRLKSIRCENGYEPEFILVGRPEAYRELQSPTGSGWQSMRLTAHTLKSLGSADVGDYINHRLKAAGLAQTLFTDSARDLIGHLANGSLTAANLLCQMALVQARKEAARVVDEDVVRSARMAISAEPLAPKPPRGVHPSRNGELVVSRGDRVVARYPLAAHMLLGRSKHNHVRLKSSEISSHHAAIVKTPRGIEIVDLDSEGGLSVNGERTARHALSDRDVVTLGPYRLELVTPAVGSEQVRHAATPLRPSPQLP